MKLETNLKPFDLEKALKGEQVVTRDGRPVTQLTYFECDGEFPLIAVIDSIMRIFTMEGTYFEDFEHKDDLFMKPNTEIVNGFGINAPEKVEPKSGDLIFIADPLHENFYIAPNWYSTNDCHPMLLERGLVYLNKEDAIAKGKALLGINPHKNT